MERSDLYRFCPLCGGSLEKKQIKKGEPERLVCSRCSFVFYIDPKIAACTIMEVDGKILLVKRAISPSAGKWVLPGGFVDAGEEVGEAAVREACEETGLDVAIRSLVGVYSYSGESVVIVVYIADITGGTAEARDETLEVKFFAPSEIPWNEIAFRSTRDALKDYLRGRGD
ncbi:MAG: NUDIX hydrolase [Deltaproteobacteria bacterium]|nr:NUDIX hydrolase [Deltaproteobacteria bacterium]